MNEKKSESGVRENKRRGMVEIIDLVASSFELAQNALRNITIRSVSLIAGAIKVISGQRSVVIR